MTEFHNKRTHCESTAVYLEACDCLTPLGDAQTTAQRLARGESALALRPFAADGTGDAVPLAIFEPLSEACPPHWVQRIQAFSATIPDKPWGTGRFPVIVTSSNFGIGQFYQYGRDFVPERKVFALPHTCLDTLAKLLGWGQNRHIITNACVSAQLGLIQAERQLRAGCAESVLVFSFDFLSAFVCGGFHALKILNDALPAPYADRSVGSIGLGEGIAYAVLSKERGDFVLSATATHFESWHMTGNEPTGLGFRTLAEQVSAHTQGLRCWIKGHGTGTLEAGRLEAVVCKEFFPQMPLVGWKGSLGHTLGSCGLVELSIAIASMRLGRVPGTVGSVAPFFADNVSDRSFSAQDLDAVILLSNAFAGAHAAHVIRCQ